MPRGPVTVAPPPRGPAGPRGTRLDLAVVAAVAGLVVVAAVVGRALLAAGVDIFLPFPPLLAEWLPHVGPGTPVAVAVAVLVVAHGPALADRLRLAPAAWRRAARRCGRCRWRWWTAGSAAWSSG